MQESTSRRNFLSIAAGIAAAGMATQALANSSQDPDPILRLIEDHKKSITDTEEIIHRVGELEEELPQEKRESNFFAWKLTIVPTDDPRWIDITHRYYEESERSDNIAVQLVSISPTTLAGVAALMEYAADHVEAGYMWPDDLADEEEDSREGRRGDWFFFLNRHLAAAVQQLAAGGATHA